MNRIGATILSIEAIVILLAIPVAINSADVSAGRAWLLIGGVAVLCIVAAGLLRRGRVGYALGSLAQVGAIALGFVVAMAFVIGLIFAALWFTLLRIGPTVERAKAAAQSSEGSGDH